MTAPRTKRVLAATRLHVGDMSKPPDLSKLSGFVDRLSVDGCAVAVGVPGSENLQHLGDLARDVRDAVKGARLTVDVLPVSPWGSFLPALNALVSHAARQGYDYVLFASVETCVTEEVVSTLASYLDADPSVLVAGAALEGHQFKVGEHELSGVTTPWNTLALWRVDSLAILGFPLVAEGLHADTPGGVEEVSAIEALRRVAPGRAKAVLVSVPGVSWQTKFDDPKRAQWQATKMASKATRAARHLELLGPGDPTLVTHVVAQQQ